jgi:hypothetical protein
MRKLTISILSVLTLSGSCLGQSKYNNQLQPGLNTRTDVSRVLGRPIRTLSATQFEYKAPAGVKRLIVEYRRGSAVIERIQTDYPKPYSRSGMIEALGLPNQPDANKQNGAGRLVEYFQDPALVLTYASSDASSGVESLDYYSRELFDRVAGIPRRRVPAQTGDMAQADTNAQPPELPPFRESETPSLPESSPEQRQYEELIHQARASIGGGDFGQAGGLLRQANEMGLGPEAGELFNSTYTDLINRAGDASRASEFSQMIRLSRQAISLSPESSDGYVFLGWAQLYGDQDFASAESAMRAAIERDGMAQFSVTHDDGGVFENYCIGILSIGRSGITYKSNNMRDSFTVSAAAVREAKLNSIVASLSGAFHIKILQQNGGTRNYNFLPKTRNVVESDMIVRLIRNY